MLRPRRVGTATTPDTLWSTRTRARTTSAHIFRGRAAFEAAEVEEAERCFEMAARPSAGLGQPALRLRVVYPLAGWRIATGDFSEAEHLVSKTRESAAPAERLRSAHSPGHLQGRSGPGADKFAPGATLGSTGAFFTGFGGSLWCRVR